VEPLIAALKNQDQRVRATAAKVLGEIRDVRAVEPLVAALTDSDRLVRWAAADALGELKDTRAVEPLMAALTDEDWLRNVVEKALKKIRDAQGSIKTPLSSPAKTR
jgi:HEAT repeat protein